MHVYAIALALGSTTLEPFHAVTDRAVRTETDWWIVWPTIGAALASAALAFFTWRLASQTASLSNETKRVADETSELARETLESVNISRVGADIADQHHQESQSPVIVLRGLSLKNVSKEQRTARFELRYDMSNVGFGPALDIRIEVAVAESVRVGLEERPLAASETTPAGGYHPLAGAVSSGDARLFSPFPPAVVKIYYRNIFGGMRTTTYVLDDGGADATRVVNEKIGPQEIIKNRASSP